MSQKIFPGGGKGFKGIIFFFGGGLLLGISLSKLKKFEISKGGGFGFNRIPLDPCMLQVPDLQMVNHSEITVFS